MHRKEEVGDECVELDPHILDIVHENIHILEHFGSRRQVFTIKAVELNIVINYISDLYGILHITHESMFGPEKNHDNLGMCGEKIPDMTSSGVYGCLIDQKPKPFSLDEVQMIFQKILQTRLHPGSTV
jgi:hypothetical protein